MRQRTVVGSAAEGDLQSGDDADHGESVTSWVYFASTLPNSAFKPSAIVGCVRMASRRLV